eukprot:SAG11_NODE_3250_length_2581_cov_12.899678_2_plen_335_part_00
MELLRTKQALKAASAELNGYKEARSRELSADGGANGGGGAQTARGRLEAGRSPRPPDGPRPAALNESGASPALRALLRKADGGAPGRAVHGRDPPPQRCAPAPRWGRDPPPSSRALRASSAAKSSVVCVVAEHCLGGKAEAGVPPIHRHPPVPSAMTHALERAGLTERRPPRRLSPPGAGREGGVDLAAESPAAAGVAGGEDAAAVPGGGRRTRRRRDGGRHRARESASRTPPLRLPSWLQWLCGLCCVAVAAVTIASVSLVVVAACLYATRPAQPLQVSRREYQPLTQFREELRELAGLNDIFRASSPEKHSPRGGRGGRVRLPAVGQAVSAR